MHQLQFIRLRALAALALGLLGLCHVSALHAGDALVKPSRGVGTELLFTSMRTGSMQIFRIGADGSKEARLTQTQSAEIQPTWSGSGRIAFVSHRSGGGDIYTMNADGRDVRRLTTQPGLDHSPAWSSDGKRLAYVSERDGMSVLCVVNADGSNEQVVSGALTEVAGAEWSPDGSKLAFLAVINDKRRIAVADLAAGSVGTVTDGKDGETGPIWSPDGKAIVYVQSGGRTEGINLRLVRLDNKASVALTPSTGYTNSQPRFSPDGAKILFLSNASSQGAKMNLSVMNADGTGITNLTHWDHADMSATWSGDGRHIFFMSFRDWPGQVYRVDANGGNLKRLTKSNAQEGFPVTRPAHSALAGGSQLR